VTTVNHRAYREFSAVFRLAVVGIVVPRPEMVEYFGACWNPLKTGEVWIRMVEDPVQPLAQTQHDAAFQVHLGIL